MRTLNRKTRNLHRTPGKKHIQEYVYMMPALSNGGTNVSELPTVRPWFCFPPLARISYSLLVGTETPPLKQCWKVPKAITLSRSLHTLCNVQSRPIAKIRARLWKAKKLKRDFSGCYTINANNVHDQTSALTLSASSIPPDTEAAHIRRRFSKHLLLVTESQHRLSQAFGLERVSKFGKKWHL